jgi:hypothetical protein
MFMPKCRLSQHADFDRELFFVWALLEERGKTFSGNIEKIR